MPTELARRLLARDRTAVAEALNLVEDERDAQRDAATTLLCTLEQAGTGALRVGITGAPGAGKSTLIDGLVRELRSREKTIGIIAVDPSSQASGGALLGDRLRVRSAVGDEGVFLRSLAARDRLGGLSASTRAGVEILASAFDLVLVETVGVGQSESEIMNLVHTLSFVAQPGAGDSVQFMKAGLLEMPDIFIVNKADLGPAAERSRSELQGGLGLSEAREGAWTPPILLASARDSEGIGAIVDAIFAHRQYLEESQTLAARLERGRLAWLLTSLRDRYGSHGLDAIGGAEAVRAKFEAEPDLRLPQAIGDFSQAIEAAIRAR